MLYCLLSRPELMWVFKKVLYSYSMHYSAVYIKEDG